MKDFVICIIVHNLSFIICGLNYECRETPALILNIVLHMKVVTKALFGI